MNKSLYEEALIDAKKLKEVAEDNAKKAIIEEITSKIKNLIEKQLLEEDSKTKKEDGDDDDEEEDVLLDLVKDEEVEVGISLPDHEGKVTLDMDKFLEKEMAPSNEERVLEKLEQEKSKVKLEAKKEKEKSEVDPVSKAIDLNVEANNDDQAGEKVKMKAALERNDLDEEDEELELDTESINILRKLSSYKEDKNTNSENIFNEVYNLFEEINSYVKAKRINESFVNEAIEKLSFALKKDEFSKKDKEIIERKINRLKKLLESRADKRSNKMKLDEGDVTLKLSGLPEDVDEDELDVEVVSSVAEEPGEEMAEEEPSDESDEEAEASGEEESEEGAEELPEEGHQLKKDKDIEEDEDLSLEDMDDDTVLEISEHDLRREISNMRAQRRIDENDEMLRSLNEEEDDDSEKDVRSDRSVYLERFNNLRSKNRELFNELTGYKKAVFDLKEKLVEMNLFNAKLLYTNKLLQSDNVTPKQKLVVAKRLDDAKNLREVKLIYNSLVDSMKVRKRINESTSSKGQLLGSSSKVTRPAFAANLNESVELQRWAKLAGTEGLTE